MPKLSKDFFFLTYIVLIGFLLINAFLIAQVFMDRSTTGEIPWLAILLAAILALLTWKSLYGKWPIGGLVAVVVIVFGIVIIFALLTLLPENVLFTRLFKMGLVLLGGVVIFPLSYHWGKVYYCKHSDNQVSTESNLLGFDLTRFQSMFLWFGCIVLIFPFFLIPIFSRPDIIGWDTPTHIFRARLTEVSAITEYNKYIGGFQITFRSLNAAVHRFTGMNYLDIVKILPTMMIAGVSLAAGTLAYSIYRNRVFALITSLFTIAWVLSPWMVSNLFDNIMVTFFGILALICLSMSSVKKGWINELCQILFLSLAGLSHLTLSSIFLITVFQVNVLEFYDHYWKGERKDFVKHFWNLIRVPLISSVFIAVIWFPALSDFINSLALGLRSNIERNEIDPTFSWIIDYYNLAVNIPWLILGFLYIIWSNFKGVESRSLRIVSAWSTICLVFGVALQPISFLNSRFLIMIPMFILIPLGIYTLLLNGSTRLLTYQFLSQKVLSALMLGIILAANLILNAYRMITLPGLPTDYYQKIEYINHYLSTTRSSSPYIFLAEYTGPLPETYSDLWLRVIRSQISEEGLLNTYLYFGTLDYLLQGKITPLENNGLPQIKQEEAFARSSQFWFDILEEDRVFDAGQMTVFVIDSFNEGMFEKYQYLPAVDSIGSGVLVINVSNEQADPNLIRGITP